MIARCLLWICIVLSLPIVAVAQDGQSYPIQSVDFQGLKKTKSSYLERITNLRLGDTLEIGQLKTNLKYLNQLYGVANAQYELDTLDTGIRINFLIEEAATFFPIINLGGVRNNFWFQLGITDLNFLGRGSQFTTFYQNNDRRHNFNVYYRLPFVAGSKWGFSVNVLRWASVEPLYFDSGAVFYDYENNSKAASVFYQFQSNHFLEFGTTYFVERFGKNSRHDNTTTPGPDNLRQPKVLFKLIHQINELDYHYYYINGFSNQILLETVHNFDDNSRFNLLLNDFKYFKRYGDKGNLAMRLRLGLATNNATPFAPFVLDSYVNIRGSGNRIDRGTAALILNLEYRHTFYQGQRFAAQFVGFSDIGTWRNPGGNFNDLWESENFRHFIGGGFRLIYIRGFNTMLRIDYGVDIYDKNQRGFVLGVGQYF